MSNAADSAAPLRGIRVVDLTQILAGPYATMLLADLGAEVVKIERVDGGDETRRFPPMLNGQSHYFMSVNRNKLSLAVDLKRAEGLRVVRALLERSDVVVESFRPGVAQRLGLGADDVTATSPKIVYCSLSAFGQTGPWASRGAFDVAVQALGGAMSVTGEAGRPPVRMGLPMADLAAGMMAVIGILAGLQQRSTTGRGTTVDLSMLDTMLGLLTYLAGQYFMTGEDGGPVGSGHHNLVPYGAFQASDGYIVIAVLTDSFWRKLCVAMDMPELGMDERYDTTGKRRSRRDEVERIVSDVIRSRTVAAWERRLDAADVPHAPILSISQALGLQQVRARSMVQTVQHPAAGALRAIANPIMFDGERGPRLHPAPLLGEHTRPLLEEILGYSPEEVNALAESKVIVDGAVSPAATSSPAAGAD